MVWLVSSLSVWLHQCLQTTFNLYAHQFWESGHQRGKTNLSAGSCMTTKDYHPFIANRLWPIYRKATLLLMGPPLLFFLSPLFHDLTFPVLIQLLFINSLLSFCSVVIFLTSISIYNIPDTLPVVIFSVLCKCVMIKIAFHHFKTVCKKCYLLRCEAGRHHWVD